MNRWVIGLFVFAASLSANVASAGDEVRVIALKHRPAEELLPVLRPLLPPADAISGTDFRLFVRTSERNFKNIERMVTQLDIERANLTLTVRRVASSEANRVLHELRGEINAGDNIHIKLPHASNDDGGLTVGGNTADNRVQYHAKRSTTSGVGEQVQVLRVQEGQRAFIHTGQSLPHKIVISRHGRLQSPGQSVGYQDLTSGFDVLPRLQGDMVHLSISLRNASVESPKTGLAKTHGLTTMVSIKRGEWIDLGSLLGYNDESRRAILESTETTTNESQTFLLKVE